MTGRTRRSAEPTGPRGERTCIASGEQRLPEHMVRYVLDPAGMVTPDVAARLPGRGVWVSADAQSLAKAMKRGGFSRGFERPVSPPEDLIHQTGRLLHARVLSLVGLGRRAGEVVVGFDKVKDALKALWPEDARAGLLLTARDAGQDGRSKLEGLLRAVAENEPDDDVDEKISPAGAAGQPPASVDIFSSDQLGMALGREGVIHAWMKPGGFALQCRLEIVRLRGFVGPNGELLQVAGLRA